MRQRLLSEAKKGAVLISAGIIYYIIISQFETALPCIFNLLTGKLCPACGVTRMIESMLKFDFESAFGYNKALFLTWPVILAVFIYYEVRYIKTGVRALSRAFNILLWAEIILLLLFGVVRNII